LFAFLEKEKKLPSNGKQIELSQSVGVGLPQRALKHLHKIEIVYPLEMTYRPRYKSDYFAQSGKSRKPRYVADRTGNHFITLRVREIFSLNSIFLINILGTHWSSWYNSSRLVNNP
jgi:hypothetical protein